MKRPRLRNNDLMAFVLVYFIVELSCSPVSRPACFS